jgi:aspartyl/asparaginyl beta-hydroxylase (cupin superfamily)/Tfp pilus assembly protein PilF
MTAPATRIDQLLAAADAAQAARDVDTAARHLQDVLAIDPAHPRALNTLGLRALHRGDARTGADLLRRATQADGTAAALWFNLSTALRALGDDAGELAALDASLARDPYMLHALLAKGQLHERIGDHANATRTYTGLLKASPPNPRMPPAIANALAHAHDYVTAHANAFAAALDTALGNVRAAAPAGATARFDRAVDAMTGRNRVYYPEPTGLNFPFVPAIEFFDRSHFPWLAALEAATPAIQAELAALLDGGGDGFAPYVAYAPGTPVNQWEELNHSTRWSAFFLARDGELIAEHRARCPATAAALDALPQLDIAGRGPAAFFSLLRPRTHIPPHTGVTNIRSIVHLPLIVPPGCHFRVGGSTRAWRIGEAFVFDDTIEHEAWNSSDDLRAVLIFDVWNPYLTAAERDLLRALYPAVDARGSAAPGFNDA